MPVYSSVSKPKNPTPLWITDKLTQVWEIINTDYLGPLLFSCYVVSNTRDYLPMKAFLQTVSYFGIPRVVVLDNEAPF